MRTVELLGDDGLDRAVRAAWGRLDQAGLSSLSRHRHPTNRPHVTLASADQLPPGALAVIADALRGLPIPVQLGRLHFFGGRAGVLAWAVDGGSALAELQAQVWSALDGAGRHPQHEPGAWTPHISLARRLRPDQTALAAQAVLGVLGVGVQAVGEAAAGGTLNGARSYDSVTRTVIPLPLTAAGKDAGSGDRRLAGAQRYWRTMRPSPGRGVEP